MSHWDIWLDIQRKHQELAERFLQLQQTLLAACLQTSAAGQPAPDTPPTAADRPATKQTRSYVPWAVRRGQGLPTVGRLRFSIDRLQWNDDRTDIN
jgi:hypothetical protein